MTTRRKKIYEGKAKILFEGPEPGTLIQYFKDDTTAFFWESKAVVSSLKYWIRVPGSGPSKRILALPS